MQENHWYFHDSTIPTPQSVIEHLRLIASCDLNYPIILDQQRRGLDGMHRVCKAVIDGIGEIPAVQFPLDSEPDYVACDPGELPYA